jgi:hypothetical protein
MYRYKDNVIMDFKERGYENVDWIKFLRIGSIADL